MNPPRWFEGDYVRVRASIDVTAPLIRFAPLSLGAGKRTLLQVKYEKIGYFCHVCGILGHDMEECGDGVHKLEVVQYGAWMLAKRRAQIGGTFNGRASSAGRTGGRGRGGRGDFSAFRKRTSIDAFETDIDDTASSPVKKPEDPNKQPGEEILGVAKMLDFEEKGEVEGDLNMEEKDDTGVENLIPPPPPGYIPPREKKRSKKATGSGKSDSANDGSAASLEEDRRDQ
jgi:hypothetical protein